MVIILVAAIIPYYSILCNYSMITYILDARTATNHFPGIGRYVANLAKATALLLRPNERLILLRDPGRPSSWDLATPGGDRVQVVDVPLSPFSLRPQWAIPRLLHRLGADLYHSPYYLMPYRPGVPTVLTVYDLIPRLFPQYVSFRARCLFRLAMALALRAANHVIVISAMTGSDLQAIFQVKPDRVTVIPLAADPAFYPRPSAEVEAIRLKYGLPEVFILYVGSNKPHKNLARLIRALAQFAIRDPRSAIPLVVAGVWDPRHPEPRLLAERLGLKGIRWLGPVPEADLPALYSGATLFVFPSLYEGFGLPVLEAMACGTPVICSQTSGLSEVAGDAALLVDPYNVDAWAMAIEKALADRSLREEMRAKGLAQAARYSWQRTARATLAVYERLVGARPASPAWGKDAAVVPLPGKFKLR